MGGMSEFCFVWLAALHRQTTSGDPTESTKFLISSAKRDSAMHVLSEHKRLFDARKATI